MNVKNLNPLERHVEKIVLAVAAAGALYIGYLSLQPIYVPNTEIKAGEVEAQVTTAIEGLKSVRAHTVALKDLSSQMVDYVQQYQDIMLKQPLPPELTAASAVPPFAPVHQPVGASGGITSSSFGSPKEIVSPTVPSPKNVTAISTLATIIVETDAATPPAVPPAPGTPAAGVTKDANWVTISGEFPMADFIAQMNDPSLRPDQKLSSSVQHTAIYRIEVQRRSRSNGDWSAWESIPAPNQEAFNTDWSKVSDTDLPGVVSTLENALSRITEPPPHTLANGQPAIPPILQTEVDTSAPPKPAAPAVAPKPAVEAPPAASATPAAKPIVLPDPNTLHSMANVPFWVFDEHVTPGSEYQYQVRVVMYNPTYRFPEGLKDPKMKDQPTIASAWYTVPGTVDVAPTPISSSTKTWATASGGSVLVGFWVYKWTSGKWYETEWTVQPGMPISGKVTLKDQGNKVLEAQTGYSLVDAMPGTEMRAVLLSPSGELVTRSSLADSPDTNKKRQDLEDRVKASAPPPPPPPAAPTPKPIPRPQSSGSSSPTPSPESNTGRSFRNPDNP